MLTIRQRDLLSLVAIHAERGHTPSYTEMGEALGLKSKSSIARIVDGLIERGFLHKSPARPRSLEILKLPAGRAFRSNPDTLEVPVLGSVVHGSLVRDPRGTSPYGEIVVVAGSAVPKGADLVAVRIHKAGCPSLGLLDGDILVMARNLVPSPGSIVLVPREGGEAIGRVVRSSGPQVVDIPADGALHRVASRTVTATSALLLRTYN